MYLAIAAVFIFGYLFISLEHSIQIDKAATALFTGVLCWVLLMLARDSILTGGVEAVDASLLHHIGEIAEILFFLLGAMIIVELIDSYDGFELITNKITTSSKVKLLWIICITTFFFSAILDNLTTAILMAALLKKIFNKKEDLWFFAGMVVIAANAGGAWSPIGDVTTIMLWIGGQVTALNIIVKVFLPSLACLIIPLCIASIIKKGTIERPTKRASDTAHHIAVSQKESNVILISGVLGLLFVPIFKNLTHLPPFMGILLSLSILWILTELMHRNKPVYHDNKLKVISVIRKVDVPSVLFFLGILLAVASLQTAGLLTHLAGIMNESIGNMYMINILIGLLSSVVDNVPLVAGAIGMYPLSMYAPDHSFWEFLAYCAGTGGSVLIIGSAAGVAIMGILKMNFVWYLKKISWLAILGYFAGALVYYIFDILL